ncbi:conserved exported hypothetical protein [Candidatus Sulfotelmatobacter kueseliae]|uniref:Carboxypeptidase regulatory-like domain-containing protein n=1 Tax=Candidatus Sulfotelmatobacter kueseliae TaxID=2042962 RepID=A0A2U3K107_9BACT|nr:conserved exported hypothetical protein [Candidatus Sulfotelmatobacter kueseliae]
MNRPKLSATRVGTAALGCPVERSSTAHSAAKQPPRFARPDSRGRLSPHRCLMSLAFTLLLSTFASAQTLTGTVKNATTGTPGAGDEVVLLSLGQGMEESGRTQSDAKGHFSFKLDDAQSPHLVRVIHQEVTYHRMAPPGTTSVEVDVYDVSKKVEGIEVVADIMRLQVEQGQLEVMRAFAVQNNSKPPRTQMNERNLEFYVPEGAQIIESEAMTANGQPLNSAPVPVDDKKTRYAYLFPLRPGTTQFQLAYQLPYTGSANIDPKSIYPLQHFVAILPKTMQFSAAPSANFQPMSDPQQPDANVQVASGATLGRSLAFKVSGEGTLEARNENAGQPGDGAPAQAESRPGGGLGPPIDAPDPLHRYQFPILIGVTLALAGGGVFTAFRQQTGARAAFRPKAMQAADQEADASYEEMEAVAASAKRGAATQPPKAPVSTSSMLLEGLKEELFQLEVEHKQGRISQQEYEKTKAALDQTLQRALKRATQKT